jgi:hypothetical protein
MTTDDDCGVISEMLDSGNRSIRGKPASVSFCPSEITHDLAGVRWEAGD